LHLLLDAVLESVVVFRLAAGAVAEVVVPLGLAKAGFLSGCTVLLGIVAATEERSEAKFHACVIIFVLRVSPKQPTVSTIGIFCQKNGKCCTIKYYVRKIRNPWILGKHEIQYFIVLYFPFFRQKKPLVLNLTLRSEKDATRRCFGLSPFFTRVESID
jgi:hypothetical protein